MAMIRPPPSRDELNVAIVQIILPTRRMPVLRASITITNYITVNSYIVKYLVFPNVKLISVVLSNLIKREDFIKCTNRALNKIFGRTVYNQNS